MSDHNAPKRRQVKRRHHTVPRFYLRGFADGREQLIRVPIDGKCTHKCGIGDASVVKDFYNFVGADGQLDDAVENAFGRMEDAAAGVFREVLEDDLWPLPTDSRLVLAQWVAAQFVRGTADRQMFGEAWDLLVKMQIAIGGKEQLRDRLEALGPGPLGDADVDQAWREVSDFGAYTVDTPVNEHIASLGHRIEVAVNVLVPRTWVFVRFKRRSLITSDHPVVLIKDPSEPGFLGIGLSNAAAVAVPLSRRAALLMLDASGRDVRLDPNTLMARDLNQRVAASARSAVFHHPEDGLVRIRLPEPRLREVSASQGPEAFLRPGEAPR